MSHVSGLGMVEFMGGGYFKKGGAARMSDEAAARILKEPDASWRSKMNQAERKKLAQGLRETQRSGVRANVKRIRAAKKIGGRGLAGAAVLGAGALASSRVLAVRKENQEAKTLARLKRQAEINKLQSQEYSSRFGVVEFMDPRDRDNMGQFAPEGSSTKPADYASAYNKMGQGSKKALRKSARVVKNGLVF